MVSDIPAGEGKIANLFLMCTVPPPSLTRAMVNVKNTFTLVYFVRIFFNADRKYLFFKKRGLKLKLYTGWEFETVRQVRRMESLLEVWEVNFRLTDMRIQVRLREEPTGECKVGPAG